LQISDEQVVDQVSDGSGDVLDGAPPQSDPIYQAIIHPSSIYLEFS